jgi:Domain of unknown function (DUF1707)
MTSSDDRHGAGPGPEAELRVSDAERDLVATELGEHFQAGRLDQAEFDERVGAALRARTRRDLSGLLADLPRRQPVSGAALPGGPAGYAPSGPPGRPGWAVPWLPVVPLLFAVIVVAGFAAGGDWHHGAHQWGGGPWPLHWLWWLIPVALLVTRRRRGRGHWARGHWARGQWTRGEWTQGQSARGQWTRGRGR